MPRPVQTASARNELKVYKKACRGKVSCVRRARQAGSAQTSWRPDRNGTETIENLVYKCFVMDVWFKKAWLPNTFVAPGHILVRIEDEIPDEFIR